jgi:acetylornithine deacetylase/succinyl-diaminopimelate desuccinylase-like protein
MSTKGQTVNVMVMTTRYVWSHGAPPRGDGAWAFNVDGETFWTEGMYSACRREAQRYAAKRGVSWIEVMP